MDANENTFPSWQEAYRAVTQESDPDRLYERVMAAEAAIFRRLQELQSGLNSDTERRDLKDAIEGLYTVKTQKLNWPDWKPWVEKG